MAEESTFGKQPERLKRLFSIGADDLAAEGKDLAHRRATLDLLAERPGSHIGRYRLLRVLGEGGMGMVYLAEQAEPIKRRVALKVIKPGMDSARVIARFEAERQALALLDHPHIAHVYDAGITEAGRPYFVMAHIAGLPITAYCDEHKLTIEQRLRLFQQVCLAVQHAHQKGIIHRDLKPSNILVTQEGDRAVPKIIDFGVAKAIAASSAASIGATMDGQLLGTPEYMSPEQADLAVEDIDTRSDVYSLGVLLYELLTGVLPFDRKDLRDSGIEHFRQTVREADPKTPSTRLTKLGDEATAIADNRQMEIQTLARSLRKELEWIPLKAMRKDRSLRYRSASEIADDIENYLQGIPLLAGPPTAGYRLRKFLRRHKPLVGSIVAVLIVSLAGTIVSVTLALGQARARAEAERQANISQAVTTFLGKGIFAAVRTVGGTEELPVDVFRSAIARLLDVATENLENEFADSPAVEAEIRLYLGNAYWVTSGATEALPHFERSYELRRGLFGERDGLTVGAKWEMALASSSAGRYTEAERLWRELIETRPSPWWECNLANTYLALGRYEDAERLFVKNLETDSPWWNRPQWRAKDPNGTPYVEDLATVYVCQGRYRKAERLFEQFMAEQGGAVLGQAEMIHLGDLYMAEERYPEAEDLFARGLAYCDREMYGKGYPMRVAYMHSRAVLRTKQQNYREAERLFEEVSNALQKWRRDGPIVSWKLPHYFGVLRREQGRYDDAERLLKEALEVREARFGPDHPAWFESRHELAVLHFAKVDYEKAAPLLLEAYHGREAKLGSGHPDTVASVKALVGLYEAWGKGEEAAQWRARLDGIE